MVSQSLPYCTSQLLPPIILLRLQTASVIGSIVSHSVTVAAFHQKRLFTMSPFAKRKCVSE